MKRVRVKLGNNGYNILIGSGLLMQTGARLKQIGFSDKLVIITDPTVRSLYGNSLKQSLTGSGFKVALLEVPAGEEQKSLETAARLRQSRRTKTKRLRRSVVVAQLRHEHERASFSL